MKNRTKIIGKILIAVLVFFIPVIISAQDMMFPYGASPKVMERIETLKMWKLTEVLELSDEQAAKLFPAMTSFRKTQDSLRQEMAKYIDQLRDAIHNNADSSEISDIISEITDVRNAQLRNESDFYGKLKEILTIEQQGKYFLFEVDFHRKMMDLIRDFHKGEMRHKRGNSWK